MKYFITKNNDGLKILKISHDDALDIASGVSDSVNIVEDNNLIRVDENIHFLYLVFEFKGGYWSLDYHQNDSYGVDADGGSGNIVSCYEMEKIHTVTYRLKR